jgi:hypothetical protein
MAIKGLTPASLSEFRGKDTLQNLANEASNTLLSAKNVLVLADQQMRRTPGYTRVTSAVSGPVYSTYDFERTVDGVQTVFVHSGSNIIAMNADGTNQLVMSTTENSTPHVFVQNAFNCYSSNGTNAYRYVDNAGTLTRYNWGIVAPTEAPAITLSGGTLTLTYGRTYVYCYVSEYTDSLGIQRLHISAPSHVSAASGPFNSGIVNLTDITASTDPQVNWIWLFATTDSPVNTSATFYFMAQIANGVTSYGDENLDTALDETKLAPFGNFPAPPSAILTTFQNSIWAANGSMLRYSGGTTVIMGIPEEAWPVDQFFNVPAGTRTISAMTTLLQGGTLAVLTEDTWFGYTGTSAAGFTEQDQIASPGCIGNFALTTTPFGVAWMSPSKRIFMWTGSGSATEISGDIMYQRPGTYSMEDLADADLPTVQLQWFSYGKYHFLLAFARTSDSPDPSGTLNLMQVWSIPVKGSQSTGEFTGSSQFYTQIGGIFETDKLPAVSFTGTGIVKVGYTPYVYMGDASGNIYRFPDGFQDALGTELISFESNFTTPWQLFGSEYKKRLYWVDLYVDIPPSLIPGNQAIIPVEYYKVWAACSESPEDTPQLGLGAAPVDSLAFRAEPICPARKPATPRRQCGEIRSATSHPPGRRQRSGALEAGCQLLPIPGWRGLTQKVLI